MSHSYNGGIYGDYELAKSTRVLENRGNHEIVYKNRLYNARGAEVSLYVGGLSFLAFSLFSPSFLKLTIHCKNKLNLINFLGSSFVGLSMYKLASLYIGDRNEYKYLIKNKETILEKIKKAQLEDFEDRNNLFPTIEEKTKEAAIEKVEEVVESSEEGEKENSEENSSEEGNKEESSEETSEE